MRQVRATRLQRVHHQGEMMRQPEVVVPVVGDDLAASLAQSHVVRPTLVPAVLRKRDPTDARIPGLRDHLRRIVGTAVADDEQLEVGERLPQHARDRIPEHAAPVVGRQDDGDERLHADSLLSVLPTR
jgi:hypothetical protein